MQWESQCCPSSLKPDDLLRIPDTFYGCSLRNEMYSIFFLFQSVMIVSVLKFSVYTLNHVTKFWLLITTLKAVFFLCIVTVNEIRKLFLYCQLVFSTFQIKLYFKFLQFLKSLRYSNHNMIIYS